MAGVRTPEEGGGTGQLPRERRGDPVRRATAKREVVRLFRKRIGETSCDVCSPEDPNGRAVDAPALGECRHPQPASSPACPHYPSASLSLLPVRGDSGG